MKIHSIFSIAIAATLIATASFSAMAQDDNTASSYSKYAYGMLSDGATSTQRAMGGIGYAMKGGRQINVMNPASYASIDSLTFLWDIGVSMINYWGHEQDGYAKKTGGGLDYITMEFPIGKRFGASVGLLPYSSVGYTFGSDIENGAAQNLGYGGINQLYAGFSGKVFKGFNLGVNVGYLWGKIINDEYGYTSTGATSLFERTMSVSDYSLNFGAQYSFNLNKKNELTLGVTFSPAKGLHGTETGIYYDATSDVKADTAAMNKLKGNFSTPITLGAGVSYTYNNRLMVELDYTYQPWANAKFNSDEAFERTTLSNRSKIALGAQYTHAQRGGYLSRISYRAGTYFNRDYISVLGNHVNEVGVSVGLGLPAPGGSKTLVNIGFEYKKRSTSPVKLVTEDYFNITIGVNFNEMWFWKRRFE